MTSAAEIDGVLVQWGDRLFYPGNRTVRSSTPRLSSGGGRRAAVIRQRIRATVVRRAPQVMVKVTGGGRGMRAIAAHFRYISKNGQLEFEDDRGVTREGKEALHDLVEQWRHGGSYIDETSHRREAFNIMLSMPSGTDPLIVRRAAREFAEEELGDHRYVMVLHDHQANPHVHLSVRAESRQGTSGSTRGRMTCSAGARPLRRSCAAGGSMPKLPGSALAARGATTSRSGVSRLQGKGG